MEKLLNDSNLHRSLRDLSDLRNYQVIELIDYD